MKKAVIYARYSSDRQTEQSIEGQIRTCREYAERNNIKIVDSYIDRAMSGTNDNRPAFQKMIKDSNKKAWDIVLVYKLDRFSRDKYETAIHKHTLRDNGIKLVSAMENIPDTPEGIILESLLEGMNQYYSAELSQKIKRGMRESRNKGHFTGGLILYGYKTENKRIVIDEDKAKVVKYIFEEYAKGVMVKDIINNLTEQGILNRGKPFAQSTIYNILRNEKYSGKCHIKGESYPDMYPKLIPDDLFDIVQKLTEKNKKGSKSVQVTYLLKNKLWCGYCGKLIIGESGTARNGEVLRYYKCSGKKNGSDCKKSQHRKSDIEDLVTSILMQTFITNNNLPDLIDKIMQANQNRIQDQSIINILLTEQKQIEKEINNYLDAIGKGLITMSTKRRLEELEARQEELIGKIAIEESKAKICLSKDEVEQYIKKALSNNAKSMIDMLVKKIIVYDDKLEIELNYTDRNSPDDDHQDYIIYSMQATIKHMANNHIATDFSYKIDFLV